MDKWGTKYQQDNLLLGISRHDSQVLESTVSKNNNQYGSNRKFNYDHDKSINMGTAQSKSMSDAANSKPKLAVMRNFILREGRDEDVAREPKVLTTFQKRSLLESQSKQISSDLHNQKRRSGSKHQFTENSQSNSQRASLYRSSPPAKKSARNSSSPNKSPENSPSKEKDSFYRYFTEQMVRVTNHNTELEKKLQQATNNLEYQFKMNTSLQEQNKKLKIELEQVKQISRQREIQIDHLRARLADEQKFKLEKIKQELQKIGAARKTEQGEISKYVKMLVDRDEKNNKLMQEVRNVKLENLKLMGLGDQNVRLNRKIGELITRNQELERKVVCKSETVDHLWNVKQIEYCNILGLIKMAEAVFPIGTQQH